MHIPDGLMDPLVAAAGWVEFAIVLATAVFLSRTRVKEQNLPRVAILSASIFVAQMLNFPVGGGTTGHLVGAALFSILVGPTLAIIGMSVVLLIQAMLFGDGGVTALGLNALNMAVIAPLAGWGAYTLVSQTARSRTPVGKGVAVAFAAWVSVFIAAGACAGELLVSYAVSAGHYGIAADIAVPSMLGCYSVIGLGEAAITVGLVTYLEKVAPEVFSAQRPQMNDRRSRRLWDSLALKAAAGIVVVFALLIPMYIIYASEGRDGLERTMEEAGASEDPPLLSAPFNYGETYLQILLAGVLGFLAVCLLAMLIMRYAFSQQRQDDPE